jgi:AcrR family transcriptional regulator
VSTRSTPVKRTAMKERVRETVANGILEAAELVASERGLEATSTAAIAERAEVAVGTLYNYFPDRDALLAALFALRRAQLAPRIAAAAAATKALPFEQRLRNYLGGVAEAFDSMRRFCRVVMSVDETGVKIKHRQPTVINGVIDEVATILRPAVGGSADEHAQMLIGAFKAMLHWRLARDEPLEAGTKLLSDAYLKGLAKR